MNKIWEDFSTGKITAKEAYDLIHAKLENATEQEVNELLSLSEKILNVEVPFNESNKELDNIWWKQNHED